jgi:hypothetical protein
MTRPDTCLECSGTGYTCDPGDVPFIIERCVMCNGAGHEPARPDAGDDLLIRIVTDDAEGER